MTRPEGNNYELIAIPGVGHGFRHKQTHEILHGLQGLTAEPHDLYVAHGFRHLSRQRPHVVFDVGMGVAANVLAIVSAFWAQEIDTNITIVSFDLEKEGVHALWQSRHLLPLSNEQVSFLQSAVETDVVTLRSGPRELKWQFVQGDFRETILDNSLPLADTVIYDFFSQKSHPYLWQHGLFKVVRSKMSDSGALLTYSTATAVRAVLLSCGLFVGEIKSNKPPVDVFPEDGSAPFTRGAAKGTLAAVNPSHVKDPLTTRWQQRFERSHLPFILGEEPSSQQHIREAVRDHAQFRDQV